MEGNVRFVVVFRKNDKKAIDKEVARRRIYSTGAFIRDCVFKELQRTTSLEDKMQRGVTNDGA